MIEELETENMMLRARNERLERELEEAKQELTRSQKMRDAGFTRRTKGWDSDAEEDQEPVGYVSWGYEAVWNGKPPKAESNLYTHPYVPTERQPKQERIHFPTVLRKMWSGSEVQAWLDENVNSIKEKNT
jgi:hypothetical protein